MIEPVLVHPFKLAYKVVPTFWDRVRMLFGANIQVQFSVERNGNIEAYVDVEGKAYTKRLSIPLSAETKSGQIALE